jgi:hypothetical protein
VTGHPHTCSTDSAAHVDPEPALPVVQLQAIIMVCKQHIVPGPFRI